MTNTPKHTPQPTSSEPETRVRINMKQVSKGELQERLSAAPVASRNNTKTRSGDAKPRNLLDSLIPELKFMIFELLKLDPIHAYAFSQAFGLKGEWMNKGDGILSLWRKTFLDPNLVRLETVRSHLITHTPREDVITEYFHCYGFRSSILWERPKKFKVEESCPEEFAARFQQGRYFRPPINGETDWRVQCNYWVLNLYLRHINHHHGETSPNGNWRHTVRDCVLHCDVEGWWKTEYQSDFVAISLEEEVMATRKVIPTWDGKNTDRILMTVGALAEYQKYAALCLLASPDTELEPYDIPMNVHRDFFKHGEQCAKSLNIHQDVQHRELWKETAPPQSTESTVTKFTLGGLSWECEGFCLKRLD